MKGLVNPLFFSFLVADVVVVVASIEILYPLERERESKKYEIRNLREQKKYLSIYQITSELGHFFFFFSFLVILIRCGVMIEIEFFFFFSNTQRNIRHTHTHREISLFFAR